MKDISLNFLDEINGKKKGKKKKHFARSSCRKTDPSTYDEKTNGRTGDEEEEDHSRGRNE